MENIIPGDSLGKDVCREIAEEADKSLSTATSISSTVLQPRISKLFSYISNYVTIVTSMVIIFATVYPTLLSRELPPLSDWLRYLLLVFSITALIIAYRYIYVKFKQEFNEELSKIQPNIQTLKNMGYKYIEEFKHYQNLIASCHQKLCEDKSSSDTGILTLCIKLNRLQKISVDELSSLFKIESEASVFATRNPA